MKSHKKQKKIFLTKNERKLLLYIVTISFLMSLLAIFVGRWIILIWEILLIATFLSIPKSLSQLILPRLLLGFMVLVAIFQSESLLFWIMQITINFDTYIYSTLFLIVLSLILMGVFKTIKLPDSVKISKKMLANELLILLPAVIVICAVVLILISSGDRQVAIIRSINVGQDDATHAGILGSIFRTKGNLLDGNKFASDIAMYPGSDYPTGWHITSAIFISSVVDTSKQKVIDTMIINFYAKLVSFFIALYALTLLVYSLFCRINNDLLQKKSGKVFLVFSALVINFLVTLPMYQVGFFSFLPILAYTTIAALIVIEYGDEEGTSYFDILMPCLIVASAATWVLTAPMLILTYIFVKIKFYGKNYALYLKTIIILLPVIAICLIEYKFLTKSSLLTPEAITTPGGTPLIDCWVLFASSIVLICAVFIRTLNGTAKQYLFIASPALLSLALILIYFAIRNQPIEYYYYKFQMVVLIVLLPFLLVVISKLIPFGRRIHIYDFVSTIVLMLAVTVSVPLFAGYYNTAIITLQNIFSFVSYKEADSLIKYSLDREFDPSNARYIIYSNSNGSNTALQSYQFITDCEAEIYDQATHYPSDIDKFANTLIKCKDNAYAITIYVDNKTYVKLESKLNDKPELNSIKIIHD